MSNATSCWLQPMTFWTSFSRYLVSSKPSQCDISVFSQCCGSKSVLVTCIAHYHCVFSVYEKLSCSPRGRSSPFFNSIDHTPLNVLIIFGASFVLGYRHRDCVAVRRNSVCNLLNDDDLSNQNISLFWTGSLCLGKSQHMRNCCCVKKLIDKMEVTDPQSYGALSLDIYNIGYHFLFVSSDFMMQAACGFVFLMKHQNRDISRRNSFK